MEQKIKNIYGIEMNDCKITGDIIVTDETSPKLSNPQKVGKKEKLKPFDRVLVRDINHDPWAISLFSREIIDETDGLICKYECSNGTCWNYCIPYEGNEHLLGTENDYKK